MTDTFRNLKKEEKIKIILNHKEEHRNRQLRRPD